MPTPGIDLLGVEDSVDIGATVFRLMRKFRVQRLRVPRDRRTYVSVEPSAGLRARKRAAEPAAEAR